MVSQLTISLSLSWRVSGIAGEPMVEGDRGVSHA